MVSLSSWKRICPEEGALRCDCHGAGTLGIEALGIARMTGSARITRELHTLDAALAARWPATQKPATCTKRSPREPGPADSGGHLRFCVSECS
jgi:hypothetical protein